MPVYIKDRTYNSIFRPFDNGVNWLLGNVGVWQKLTLLCEMFVGIQFDSTNQVFVNGDNFTLANGKNWNDYGFAEGDSVIFQWNHVDTTQSPPVKYFNAIGGTGSSAMFIDRIENEKAFVVDSSGNPLNFNLYSNIFPAQFGEFAVADASMYTDSQPEGIRFTYGHIENSQYMNGNLSSFIDGSLTEFLAENTDSMTFGQTDAMQFIGQQSGMSVAFCNLKYV